VRSGAPGARRRARSRRQTGWFHLFARRAARISGRPVVFGAAAVMIVLWLVTGPIFHFSDTWQLVINTTTTIVTFLMVFLIQNTQNRDTEAMQLKLDELIRSHRSSHNALLDLEEMEDEQIERFRRKYQELAHEARALLKRGRPDTGSPETL
jgi:low affinity Fe/Cu permease